MEDGEDKVESSTEVSSDAAAQCDRISDLNSQIDKLKRELEVVKKKLLKAEYERDSAQRNAENLKGEVRELSKKLQEERKKTAESRRKNSDALQSNKKIQDAAVSSLIQKKDSRQSDVAGSKDLQASLQEAAADAMSQSGFVYDDRTGLYYDWSTGYYYDPNSHLYYENTTGTYYYYDEPSATYKFHSKIDISNNQEVTVTKDDEVDKEEKDICKEYSEDDEENDLEVIEVQYPCIRAIVIKASKIKVGSLFIVTYTGGTIGREKDMSHVIRIPDVEVSKLQCKIEFDKERRQFFIYDVGSRNGTFLNGLRLSESKQKSEQRVITHGDELTLGATTLCLHIHPGTQTCDSCEPGQVQAQAPQGTSFVLDDEVCITKVVEGDRSLNSLSVQEQRKSELKRIKKAYALEESSYSEHTIDATHAGKYKDRADVRRTKVGSDVPVVIADDPPASVHRPISTGNVGRQMLEKMGWKEGEGLGREGDGRREPVIVEVRDNLRGLGAGVKRSIDDVEGKSYIRSKTRERFGQAAPVISGPQRFVAADTTKAEKKSSPTYKINNETKPTVQPNDIQVTSQTNETKEVDIFAE